MTEYEKQFISVLSSVLHDTSLPSAVYDYENVLSIAAGQQVFSLIFEKFSEDSRFRDKSIFKDFYQNNLGLVISQTRRTCEFIQLYNHLSGQGLTVLVMKGLICRKLYGKYEDHRPSGDEDILVRENEFDKAYNILIQLGYTPNKKMSDIEIDSLQAVSFINNKNGLNIELHVNPIGKGNAVNEKMNMFFSDVFDDYIEIYYGKQKILTFNHTDHFLFLCLHAFKHFSCSGCGIRQVADVLLYREKYLDEINFDYIYKCLKEVNAYLFYCDIIYIGNKYLNFNCYEKDICCPEELMNDFLGNGIFGNDTSAKIMAGTMTSMAVKNSKYVKQSGVAAVVDSIFPDYEYMKNKFPELRDKPWLLPVDWVKRWVRFVKRNRNNGGNLAAESIEIGNRRIELLKKYKII